MAKDQPWESSDEDWRKIYDSISNDIDVQSGRDVQSRREMKWLEEQCEKLKRKELFLYQVELLKDIGIDEEYIEKMRQR